MQVIYNRNINLAPQDLLISGQLVIVVIFLFNYENRNIDVLKKNNISSLSF